MKGRGPAQGSAPSDKWLRINQMMRETKTAILALQETHLTDAHVHDLHSLFGKRLRIYHSSAPGREASANGVAFVLNREKLEESETTASIVIPGRALLLTTKWHKTTTTRILNVYAPNEAGENALFWDSIRTKLADGSLPKPDILVGDFNVVEAQIDRLPARTDPRRATSALALLHTDLGLEDAWRTENPTTRQYTYAQDSGTSLSRLDRFYLHPKMAERASDWDFREATGIPTDHSLVTVSISDRNTPHVGKGRWVIPKSVLTDYNFTTFVAAAGQKLMDSTPLDEDRSGGWNIQSLYETFKADILTEAHRLAKVNIPKLVKRINNLRNEQQRLLNLPEPRDEEYIADEAAALLQRLKALEARRFGAARKAVALNTRVHGEEIGKPWIGQNKAKRDTSWNALSPGKISKQP
ncbi:DNase I-like protein [Trametopsis cervina]|nr:DNase I-like protein [Trametopsis cervina]